VKVILSTRMRKNPYLPVEAECLTPRNVLEGIRDLTVHEGNKERSLSEIFTITIEGIASGVEEVMLVLQGDLSRFKRVGEYMDGGTIRIESDIGMHCGNLMTRGTIEILGNADSWLGREMRGGRILCHQNAAHYCGAGYRGEKRGMRGGELEILGDAGDFLAEHLSGGMVTVQGNAGDLPGAEMGDGTLTIHGNCTRACANMNSGTCVVYGKVMGMIPTFRKKGIAVKGEKNLQMHVFEGDIANRGKGTLFIRDFQYLL
jgi:formylmethanofuran dehydrogenase subunit C